jgi:cell division protease FtsH
LNPFYKNLALWLVISLLMVMLFNFFNRPGGGAEQLSYSDFLGMVEKNQITSVIIQGQDIHGNTPASPPMILLGT